MFNLVSQGLKYIFILIIYLFIFSILRMIYLDIRSMRKMDTTRDAVYLKVVNRLDSLNFKMQEYYVLKGTVNIGRSAKNDIVIKDNFVSKNHLQITDQGGTYFIEDLNSANGTYLNGEAIHDIIELRNGDRIGVGFIQFIFVDK
ncbi:MAG: FHA domain-containing protein [Tissierellia bacterium]|nr:FHA domain-containing protein [Tissierellia bacterium]